MEKQATEFRTQRVQGSRQAASTLKLLGPGQTKSFWSEDPGSRIANRNLWISIPNLLCGFAVWLYWSIIIVQMQNLHVARLLPVRGGQDALLYTLRPSPARRGDAADSQLVHDRHLRRPQRHLRHEPAADRSGAGCRDRAAGAGDDLAHLRLLAALSGVGGGAFASSMSNISFFFPKRVQGTVAGAQRRPGQRRRQRDAGAAALRDDLRPVRRAGRRSQTLPPELGGGEVWIQNCGLVWVPILVVLAVLAFFFMNNLPQHNVPATPLAVSKMLWLELLGFGGAAESGSSC